MTDMMDLNFGGPPGRSAFQEWLAAGNVGTQADFLLAMKGIPGDNGANGLMAPASDAEMDEGATDEKGATPAGLKRLGVQQKLGRFVLRRMSRLLTATIDKNGMVGAYVDRAGNSFSLNQAAADAKLATLEEGATSKKSVLYWSLAHIIFYGQSNSIGYYGAPPLTTAQPAANKMLSTAAIVPGFASDQTGTASGVVPAGAFAALAPAVEATVESGLAAMVNTLSAQVANRSSFIVTALGKKGSSLAGIAKGTTWYANLIAAVTATKALADAAGEVYNVPAVPISQGEQDDFLNTSEAAYIAGLVKLADDLDADIRAITGQPNRVLLFLMPVASWGFYGLSEPRTAIYQYRAAKQYRSRFRLVGPNYQFPYMNDFIHFTNHGFRGRGLLLARVFDQEFRAGLRWEGLKPLTVAATGKAAVVHFHVPTKPLVLDTVLVSDPGAKGFEARDSGGALTIATVELIGEDGVRLVFDRVVDPDTLRIRYAWTAPGNQAGPTGGPRGCLRDSGAIAHGYLDGAGQAYKTYAWCPTFEEGITA